MNYYVGRNPDEDPEVRLAKSRAAWSEVVRSIRETDPFSNPITIHPTRYGREQVDDPNVLDLEMLQTGHSGYPTLSATVDVLTDSLDREPKMPVLVSEVNYDGIMESSREEIQRFLFWSCLLSGAAGHTYGANGIWQVNTREKAFGPSPHGASWGGPPWDDAYRLPGSAQLGLGKRLLERYSWWQFEQHDDWITPHQSSDNRIAPFAAGIPTQVRVVFVPAASCWAAFSGKMRVTRLEPGAVYHAFFFDPKTGQEHDLGTAQGDDAGEFVVPKPSILQDWVLVLER